jgi:hypothetical protein
MRIAIANRIANIFDHYFTQVLINNLSLDEILSHPSMFNPVLLAAIILP